MTKAIPQGRSVSYQQQRRKCGKQGCHTCRNGDGHGPYWYAYWREGKKVMSAYIGKDYRELPRKNEDKECT